MGRDSLGFGWPCMSYIKFGGFKPIASRGTSAGMGRRRKEATLRLWGYLDHLHPRQSSLILIVCTEALKSNCTNRTRQTKGVFLLRRQSNKVQMSSTISWGLNPSPEIIKTRALCIKWYHQQPPLVGSWDRSKAVEQRTGAKEN